MKKGGNYGWVTAEGFHCFDPFAPNQLSASCPGTGPNDEPLLNPIAEYNHNDGTAVIGGFVYRSNRSRSLFGKYVFGDFTQGLFWLDADGVRSDIFKFRLGEHDEPLGLFLLGFGEDERGELYVLTSENSGPSGETGQIWRITVPDDEDSDKDDD